MELIGKWVNLYTTENGEKVSRTFGRVDRLTKNKKLIVIDHITSVEREMERLIGHRKGDPEDIVYIHTGHLTKSGRLSFVHTKQDVLAVAEDYPPPSIV